MAQRRQQQFIGGQSGRLENAAQKLRIRGHRQHVGRRAVKDEPVNPRRLRRKQVGHAGAVEITEDEDLEPGSDAHLRAVLDFFDLKRLTIQVGTTLLEILERQYPYVDEMLRQDKR